MNRKDIVVYLHLKPDGQIFYIGIGSNKRAYSILGRNKLWNRIVNKYNYEVQILKDNLTWEDACKIEQELILKYGRIDLKTGILCNMTDGGEGTINRIFTESHKDKLSKCQIGELNHRFGKVGVNKDKFKGEHPASKKVIDSETNQIWNCVKDCANELNYPYDSLLKMLNGNRQNKTNLKYLKKDDTNNINISSTKISTKLYLETKE